MLSNPQLLYYRTSYSCAGRMALVAEYPSSKDFLAYMSHSTPSFNRKEAVLAVHLNNSRLVHSRLAWRPDILSELASSLEQTTVAVGYKVLDRWGVINQAIEDEVSVPVVMGTCLQLVFFIYYLSFLFSGQVGMLIAPFTTFTIYFVLFNCHGDMWTLMIVLHYSENTSCYFFIY